MDFALSEAGGLVLAARVVDLAVKVFCSCQLGWVMGESLAVAYLGEKAADEGFHRMLWTRIRNSIAAWIVDGVVVLAAVVSCTPPLPGGMWG